MTNHNFPIVTRDPSSGEISDYLLLSRYLSNRAPETFLELVRRHTGLVYGTCLRITANPHDAEELTQECFFDLSRQAGEIRTSLVGWLHRTAVHRALNRLRSERRRQEHEREAGQLWPSLDPAQLSVEPSWAEIAPQVDQALSELPEQLRVPILMHYLEGVSQYDIANTLGVHQSTVSRRLSDGLNSLRDGLRQAGLVIPATMLATCLISQSAMAAPPALVMSLGKIGLAGIGTSISAKIAGAPQIAWLSGGTKGVVALFFVPVVAGVLWGELVFLLILVTCCCYLGWRRPEWFRVLCYTRQFPNIYEWPFFPFKRWTWQSPPGEWRIWMAASLVTGIELLGLGAITSLFEGLRPSRLLLVIAGLWQVFMGIRIWCRVRRCRGIFGDQQLEAEVPVDGALLLTYAFAGVMLFAKLCVSPWFLSQPGSEAGTFWLMVLCVVSWATVLMWGSILVLGRYRRWRIQGVIEPSRARQMNNLAPPRWLLGTLMIMPLAFATLITFTMLVQDVHPVYVPFGDDALAVARRRVFAMTLLAMDFVVLTILPLAYLYRRIPRIAWGVGFGVVGLISAVHLGLFARNLIAAPAMASTPIYAPPPRMELLPGHFILENPPNLLENRSASPGTNYMGKSLGLGLRLPSTTTIRLEYPDHTVRLNVAKNVNGRESEVGVSIMISPYDFKNGNSSNLQVSLIIVDSVNRHHQVEEFWLSLPEQLSPADWAAQFELLEQAAERAYPLGRAVNLGMIQGMPLELNVTSLPSEKGLPGDDENKP